MRSVVCFFFLMKRRPPRSPLFPYPTPFRSERDARGQGHEVPAPALAAAAADRPRLPLPLEPRPAAAHLGLGPGRPPRSEEQTSEIQSRQFIVCRLLLEKKK